MIPLSLSYPYPLIFQHPLPPFSFNFPFPVLYFKLPMSFPPFRLTYPHFFLNFTFSLPTPPLSQLTIPSHLSTPQADHARSLSFNSPCPLPIIYPYSLSTPHSPPLSQVGWPGRYINVRHCGGMSIVLVQKKDPLELFKKSWEFLSRRDMT